MLLTLVPTLTMRDETLELEGLDDGQRLAIGLQCWGQQFAWWSRPWRSIGAGRMVDSGSIAAAMIYTHVLRIGGSVGSLLAAMPNAEVPRSNRW